MTPGYTGDVTDKQAIFDFVWKFLTEQGAPARSGLGCYYRRDGKACAAGCLIPDSEYDAAFDISAGACGTGIGDHNAANAYFVVKGYDIDFVAALQRCHDSAKPASFVASFQGEMQALAIFSGLTAPAA
jgi:hypothetical protein